MLNGAADLDIVRVTRDSKDGHIYVQTVLDRVKTMAERGGANAVAFLDELWKLYAQRSPALGLWAYLNEEGHVAGHVLAIVQLWDYEYVGWVSQIEFDPIVSQSTYDRGLGELDAWLTAVNVTIAPHVARKFIMTTAHNPKVFERRAGFRVMRTMMERPLPRSR